MNAIPNRKPRAYWAGHAVEVSHSPAHDKHRGISHDSFALGPVGLAAHQARFSLARLDTQDVDSGRRSLVRVVNGRAVTLVLEMYRHSFAVRVENDRRWFSGGFTVLERMAVKLFMSRLRSALDFYGTEHVDALDMPDPRVDPVGWLTKKNGAPLPDREMLSRWLNEDANDEVVSQGDVKFFLDRKTKRFMRGIAYGGLNAVWHVFLPDGDVRQLHCTELYSRLPCRGRVSESQLYSSRDFVLREFEQAINDGRYTRAFELASKSKMSFTVTAKIKE